MILMSVTYEPESKLMTFAVSQLLEKGGDPNVSGMEEEGF
jgi:hypothetical protein